VAVVQISKIQHRRGKEQSGSGLPQLASGELGWAVDTQSLYIGNGSVSEGAPQVGNTKIITEHDNILDFVADYIYLDGEIQTREGNPVQRSLSQRLDDRVSLRSFGAKGNSEDAADQLQKALYELYLRQDRESNPQSRVVLHIEPGVYVLSKTVYVPPYTTMIGAGKTKTIFKKTGNFAMFETISSAPNQYTGQLNTAIPVAQPQLSGTEPSRKICLENMTLENVTNLNTVLKLNSTRDSVFRNIEFLAPMNFSAEADIGVEFVSKNDAVACENNQFIACEFIGMARAAKTNTYIRNTVFERCSFKELVRGIDFADEHNAAQSTPEDNSVTLSTFNNIQQEAVYIGQGTRNTSSLNVYGNSVGNAGGSALSAQYPVIFFGESGNLSVDDEFKRSYNAGVNQQFIVSAPYLPEVQGPAFYDRGYTTTVQVPGNTTPALLFRLDAQATKKYVLEYHYASTVAGRDFTRNGELDIFVNRQSNTAEIVDDYEISGLFSLQENLKFSANLVDNGGNWAVNVLAENPNDTGKVTYLVKSRS
jgi:hypothetical protein